MSEIYVCKRNLRMSNRSLARIAYMILAQNYFLDCRCEVSDTQLIHSAHFTEATYSLKPILHTNISQ